MNKKFRLLLIGISTLITIFAMATISFGEHALFAGEGEEYDPYKIETYEDLKNLSICVANGEDFENKYFVLADNITVTKDWEPIGCLKENSTAPGGNGENILPFKGNFNGAGFLITYEEGARPLFGYVRGASVNNLNIFGTKIEGHGLLENYVVDRQENSKEYHFLIYNVNIKSGSRIKKSGFLGGYASGMNKLAISDCTIEKDVIIGYDKNEEMIGGFAHDFNGYISGCKNYGTVYGKDHVGGIVACKGQTMSPYSIQNCIFDGKIEATGKNIGGISGSGYAGTGGGINTSPNTPCVTIKNCIVKGEIKGKDNVGGILGAEEGVIQCWNNGIGVIKNNLFTGKIEAAEGTNIGGIIGYFNGLNKYNKIENNFFIDTCGTTKGIGGYKYIDTNNMAHETASGITYMDTSKSIPEIPGVWPGNIKPDHNRTDDPAGVDAAKLAKTVNQSEVDNGSILDEINIDNKDSFIIKISVEGEYKKEYKIGEDLDTAGMKFVGTNVKGEKVNLDTKDVEITGFSSNVAGDVTLTAKYGLARTNIFIKVISPTAPDPQNPGEGKTYIDVKFTLMGDDIHGESDKPHTLALGGLKVWIPKENFKVEKESNVKDVFIAALNKHNLKHRGSNENQYNSYYISAIQIPNSTEFLGEFSNGKKSGWMYTVNGIHPTVGVDKYILKDGDEIIFHYTDDYTKEEGSEQYNKPGDENKDKDNKDDQNNEPGNRKDIYENLIKRIKNSKIINIKVSARKKNLYIKWKKIKNANIYKVAYKIGKAKKWNVVLSKKNKITIKNFNKNSKIYVKIKAGIKVKKSKYFGRYSRIKKFMVYNK